MQVQNPKTRLEDLRAAAKIIGDTRSARLAWLVRFVNEDPQTWHSTRKAEHGDCLHALAGHVGIRIDDLPAPLTARQVVSIHRGLRSTLRALLGSAPEGAFMVKIPCRGLTMALVRATAAGVRPAKFAPTYGDSVPRTAIFRAMVDLVLSSGERLLACPSCGNPFLATGRKKYCSRECTNREAWKNYPEKKKRRSRAKQYAKRGWRLGARKGGKK